MTKLLVRFGEHHSDAKNNKDDGPANKQKISVRLDEVSHH